MVILNIPLSSTTSWRIPHSQHVNQLTTTGPPLPLGQALTTGCKVQLAWQQWHWWPKPWQQQHGIPWLPAHVPDWQQHGQYSLLAETVPWAQTLIIPVPRQDLISHRTHTANGHAVHTYGLWAICQHWLLSPPTCHIINGWSILMDVSLLGSSQGWFASGPSGPQNKSRVTSWLWICTRGTSIGMRSGG
jgi:hypothetical protein